MENKLFEPIKVGRFHAKNRFVRSATKEELCDRAGHLPDELYNIYEEFVDGGVGTIIVSSARVKLLDGTKHGGLLRLDNPDVLPEYAKLARLGKKNNCTMLIQATYTHKDIDNLTICDIDKIVDEFVDAAKFVEKAGFDGLQIHAAHTVFMSYILSPKYNHRTDEYGQNKNLLAERIVKAIRKNTNENFIIMMKINCQDFDEEGLQEEDSLRYCIRLAELGIDAIEVSGNDPIKNDRNEECYFWEFASRLKRSISIPVILVGGVKNLETITRLNKEENIDMFSMSRALTCEPDLVNRWHNGDVTKAKCLSCNACLNTHAHACILRK